MTFEVRTASIDEVAILIDMAADEGWNPGLDDVEAFLAADPEGYIVGLLDGRVVAGVSVVRSGEDFGFLGLYLCAPEHRGKGFGLSVWNEGLRRMAGRTVGLDGVPAQQENYRRSGFAYAHRNVRYLGTPGPGLAAAEGVRPGTIADIPDLIDFDADLYGASRPLFLRRWLDPGSSRVVRVCVAGGDIRGYGVIRPCRSGYKIGPLFAESEDVAEGLFRSLALVADGAPLALDPPEPNAPAVALALRHGLQPVFETARMYRGPAPELPLDRIYGITTFELG